MESALTYFRCRIRHPRHRLTYPAALPTPPDLRLAELLAALSLASDIGLGQPLEQAQRAAVLTVALGRAAELPEDEIRDAY